MAKELSIVRELLDGMGPTLSVYLGRQAGESPFDAAHDAQRRWHLLATAAARLGADPATVDAVERYLERLPYRGTELAIFAAAGAVQYGRSVPGGAPFDRLRYGAPADVAPLLAWLQRHPPYVLVVTDRTGAEITAVARGAVAGGVTTVAGPDDGLARQAPRDLIRSQPRFERRAEDSWHHNAAAVAAAAAHALHQIDAHLLVVAGDVRAVGLLQEHLPQGVRRSVVVRHVPGGRSPDGSTAARAAAVAEAVEAYAAERSDLLVKRFVDVRGPGGAAVEGVRASLAALAAGRVATLLVADEEADERQAWFAPGVLAAPDEPAAPDAGTFLAGRLVDVAIRAAVLTDADVHIVSSAEAEEIADGIGALTRFG